MENDELTRRDFVTTVAAGLVAATGADLVAQGQVTETNVQIKTPDGTCDAAFITPATGAHPAVIIWPDAFGLRPAFEAATAWIAREDAAPERAGALRRRLFRAALRAQPGNTVRHLKLKYAPAAARRKGGLIALIGPDGAGKSTVIRTLTERASAIPTLKISTTYLGPWGQMQTRLVPTLRRLGITPAAGDKPS